MVEFAGPGLPLTQRGIDAATTALDVEPAALWAVLAVETSGCGFLADRRPKILFERHVFSRLTAHRYDADDPDVSQPTAGGYGPSGAYQYGRLMAAIQLDRAAALQSASWGLAQIMGENHDASGFAGVEEMVAAMVASEDQQLAAMAAYLRTRLMGELLQRHDWSGFARLYNGPNYAAHLSERSFSAASRACFPLFSRPRKNAYCDRLTCSPSFIQSRPESLGQ